MLVLSRKANESIVIDGKIFLDILRFEGESVKLGVRAPKNITVLRKEIYDEILESNRAAAAAPNNKHKIQALFDKKKPTTPTKII
tara:strand:+ start:2385 stop:2639 length:255 start_codon:yes stop_codon:yes gene_type:complete